MSVLTPTIDSIDGENRRIYLKAFVSDFFPIEDIYHEYRNLRRTDPDLRKWAPLLKAEGNVPKGGGAFTPRYVVLLDGTKIVPFDNTTQVNQLGDMITDDPDTDATLYDTSMITVSKVIYIKPSESEIIQLNSEAIVYSTFQGAVWVDVNSPYANKGSDAEPNGNSERPVNNMALAVEIADERGFNNIELRSNITLDTGDNIENKVINGVNATLTSVVINTGADTLNCEIRNMNVSGVLDGGTSIVDSTIGILDYVNGSIHHSMINTKITLGGNSVAHIHGCYSGVPGLATPIIDMGGSGNSLALRDYAGGIEIQNKTGPESISLDINTGQVILDSTVTNGTVVIRGNVKVTDYSVGDTIVEMDSVTIPETAYNGFVHVHPQDGTSGQAFPFGTETRPIASNDDAVAIALRYNLTKFMMKGIATTSIDAPNSTFVGDGAVQSNIIIGQGFNYDDSVFKRLTITGSVPGANCQWEECIFSNATDIQGLFQDCSIFNKLTMAGDVTGRGLSLAANPAILDFTVGSDYIFKMEIKSGNLQFENFGIDNYAQLSFSQGSLIIDSSCTGGTIQFHGNVDITDNSNGAVTLIDKSLGINAAVGVWNEPIANHLIAGTTGLSVGRSQFDGVVSINATDGTAGTVFPLGTLANPVKNIEDAVIIAEANGIQRLKFFSDYTIGNTVSISDFILEGEGAQETTITAVSGCILAYCSFEKLTVTGSVIGVIGFTDCIMSNIGSPSPVVATQTVITQGCTFQGNITMTSNFQGRLYAIDCVGVPYLGSPPTLDMGNGAFDVQLRNYSGFLIVKNSTNATSDLRFMISAGGIILDSTVTAGQFVISGVGTLEDSSTSVTSMDITSLVNQEQITKPTWESVVVDTTNGFTGTDFPNGTYSHPVDNLTDAKTIADRENISKFNVDGDITLNDDFSKYQFESISADNCTIDLNGQNTENTTFRHVGITGICSGSIHAHVCNISNVQGLKGALVDSAFMDNTPMVLASGFTIFNNCLSAVAGGNSPIFDMSAGDIDFSVRSYSGGIRFVNSTSATNKTTIEYTAGKFNFDDSNTAGEFHVRGTCDITGYDTTAGATVIMDGAVNADLVWDEVLTGATHNIPTSAGRRMRNATSSIVLDGEIVSSTINTVTLNGDSSNDDGAYDPGIIAITTGTGAGQARLILGYKGSTHTAVVDRNWKVLPDVTSEFIITSDAGREHINEGLAQGGSLNTIILNSSASDDDNTYLGQTIFIRSGLGEDQAHKVIAYNGTTHTATIYHNWNVIPDTTTGYVMLPTGSLGIDIIENAVWDAPIADHQVSGSTGHWMKKKLLTLANFIGLK